MPITERFAVRKTDTDIVPVRAVEYVAFDGLFARQKRDGEVAFPDDVFGMGLYRLAGRPSRSSPRH